MFAIHHQVLTEQAKTESHLHIVSYMEVVSYPVDKFIAKSLALAKQDGDHEELPLPRKIHCLALFNKGTFKIKISYRII